MKLKNFPIGCVSRTHNEPMKYQRGGSEFVVITAMFGIGVLLWWIGSDGLEREGYVKYDDCRETVILQPDTMQKYYRTFTCSVRKTKTNTVMGGQCVHIEYESSMLSSSRVCTVALVYQKLPGARCNDPAPYLGYDDKCYPVPQ
jgi:hypothetical protein